MMSAEVKAMDSTPTNVTEKQLLGLSQLGDPSLASHQLCITKGWNKSHRSFFHTRKKSYRRLGWGAKDRGDGREEEKWGGERRKRTGRRERRWDRGKGRKMKERERDYSQGRAVMENVCHLSTEKVEAKGSEARSSSLGYGRPCQKEGMGREKKANKQT